MRQPAAEVPREHQRKVDEPLGNARLVHHVAGQDEKRHGQQREGLRHADDLVDRHHVGQPRLVEENQAADADRKGQRHIQHQQNEEYREHDQHLTAPPLP